MKRRRAGLVAARLAGGGCVIVVAVLLLVDGGTAAARSVPDAPQAAANDDPFAHCAAVDTADMPNQRGATIRSAPEAWSLPAIHPEQAPVLP